METTIQKNGPDGLSQGRMLRLILKNVFLGARMKFVFVYLVGMYVFWTISLLTLPDLDTDTLLLTIIIFPLFISSLLLRDLRAGPRSAFPAYWTLPVAGRNLARCLVAANMAVFLFLASLSYWCFGFSWKGNGFRIPIFWALLIVAQGGLMGWFAVPAWLLRREWFGRYWTGKAAQFGVRLAWTMLSIVFLFRIAFRPSVFWYMARGSTSDRFLYSVFTSESAFAFPNLCFVFVATVVLLLSVHGAEYLADEARREPQRARHHDLPAVNGAARPRVYWHLLSVTLALPPLKGNLPNLFSCFVMLFFALNAPGIENSVFFGLFLGGMAFAVYNTSFLNTLKYLRALRTLPIRSATLSAGILSKSVLHVGLLGSIVLLLFHWTDRPISEAPFLFSIILGCVIAHVLVVSLLTKSFRLCAYTVAIIGFVMLVSSQFDLRDVSAFPNTAALAGYGILASAISSVIVSIWQLTALISHSSRVYRSLENETYE